MKVGLLLLVAACSTDPSAPNFDETRSLPGPTSAHCWQGDIEFDYDEADRLVTAGHYVRQDNNPQRLLSGSQWSYGANGEVSAIMTSEPGQIVGGAYTFWKLGAEAITETFALHLPGPGEIWKTYDPTAFAFMPLVGITVVEPTAELGLLSERRLAGDGDPIVYTWTTAGTVRTRHSSENDTATYTLDDHGRIVSIVEDRETDGSIDRTRTFEYADDRLMRTTDTEGDAEEFAYDRGGNLAQTTGPDHITCAYSYAGW